MGRVELVPQVDDYRTRVAAGIAQLRVLFVTF
jgi:hypothetical protein